MKKIGILVAVIMLVVGAPVFAGQIDENAASTDYVTKAPAMVLRGVKNIVIAPAEILGHTYKGTMEGRPFVGTLEGLGEGAIWTVDRAGRGVWDIVTAFAPGYNGAPPTHGPCLS